MFIKAYCVNFLIHIKPIYVDKHMFLCLFTIINENYNFLMQRCSLKLRIKKKLSCKEPIFEGRTILQSMLKLLKYLC